MRSDRGRWLVSSFVAAASALAIALTVLAPTARAAPPSPAWTERLTFDVRSGSLAIDRDGNVYVTGFQPAEDTEAVLTKLDPSGTPLWTRTWSPPQALVSGEAVAVAPDGSVSMAGNVAANHFEGGGWFLRKYEANGSLVWALDEPGWQHGRASDSISGLSVTGRRVLLAGSFHGCCGDFRDRNGWVIAFTPGGRRLWRSPFEPGGARNTFNDEIETIVAGPGNGIYAGGWTALGPELEERPALHAMLLQRLDPAGNVVWSRTLRATASMDQDFGVDLAVHHGTLTVSALMSGHPVQWRARPGHAWLGRFTTSGERRWSRSWGIGWTRAAEPTALAVGANGRIFVTGTRRDPTDHGLDGFVRAFRASGRVVWERKLERGRRFMMGADVAARAGSLVVASEAFDPRFGDGVAGFVWTFSVA
jgi:hypothetical protein